MAQVVDQIPFVEHVANGVTTVFAFAFLVPVAADLVVYADGVVVPSSGYTLAGVGVQAGGTVTFSVAPLNGVVILLSREIALARTTEYQTLGDFKAVVVNPDFDRLWMALQGFRGQIEGSIRAPFPQQLNELPGDPADFDGYYLGLVSGQPAYLLAPAGTAGALAGDLATTGALKGADIVGFIQSGTGAVARTAQAKMRDTVSVKDFGAVGDGVADDTAALDAAEAAAFVAGVPLLLPHGTYVYDGNLTVRVSIFGYGATIKQASATEILTNVLGVVCMGADGITIVGLTANGNLKSTGFGNNGFDSVTLRDCAAINCLNLGFGAYLCDGLLYDHCTATNVRYSTGGVPADGFYFGGCTRSTWRDCRASDVRRIGFVSEGEGATDSDWITALRCIASDTNNCDDSATEFNTAFWTENTNNIDWIDCVGYSIAGNAGQTSGRVRGMVAFAVGNAARGICNVMRCRLYGGSGYMLHGITIQGTGTFADVNVDECYVQKASSAVTVLGGLNALTITDLVGEDIAASTAAMGGIFIDGSSGALPTLVIERPKFTNSTFHADSGWVNFFSVPTGCSYTLRGMSGGTHVMRGNVVNTLVEQCTIAAGSTSYSTFLGSRVELIDSHFTSRNSANTDFIARGAAMNNGSEIIVRGGSITGFGSGWINDWGGTSITTRFYGVKTTLFCMQSSGGGTFMSRFDACEFFSVPVTFGSIYTNFAAPTRQTLIVRGCYFESANAADTPIRQWNAAPTVVVLQGNVHRVATNLHNFGAVTSVVDNVAV